MACPHVASLVLRPPTATQSVYREDCTQCFDSIDDPTGLNVCLQCFNGGCTGDRRHAQLHYRSWNHPLVLNIHRTRKAVARDEPPTKISKLAIAAEKEEDRYDLATVVRCLACDTTLGDGAGDAALAPVVNGILRASTFARKEEVQAWEQTLTGCVHVQTLQQDGPARAIVSGCEEAACSLRENLWLCLQCGHLGCGRAQFGGVGGHSHGLAHATASGHGVAVKLGSLTPEGGADVYCYTCDEERVDDQLAAHLAHWGIVLAEQQKTEMSLTELQVEQNLRWSFSTTTEDGQERVPLFGPGLTGLRNLGNSCYLASILQCLFDLPSFAARYGTVSESLPDVRDPAADLETQLRKMGDGLLSGRYATPDPDVAAATDTTAESDHTTVTPHQKGLTPAMFKHLMGRGHAEFSTMRQQDAFELLQHLIQLVTRSQHPSPADDPTVAFRFVLEQRLQCTHCHKVRYTTTEQDSIFLDVVDVASEDKEKDDKAAAGEVKDKDDKTSAATPAHKPVTLQACLDRFTAAETVDLTCGACGSTAGYTKRSLFKTLPTVLVVNARKMAVVQGLPIKVDVPVVVDDEAFLLDKYLSRGPQPDEELLPEEAGDGTPAFVANAAALAQLEAMGFPSVRCEKALHATGNRDAETAMEWLFGHMDDPDLDTPMVLSGSGRGGAASTVPAPDPDTLAMLGSMGFEAAKATRALQETDGNVERAVEWLFSHPEEVTDEADGAAVRPPAGTSEKPATYRLQSMVCHKGTSIHAGHYVAFVRKTLQGMPSWVLFNDEKVVEMGDVEDMKQFAYIYFFQRV